MTGKKYTILLTIICMVITLLVDPARVLAAEAERAAARGKSLAALLENSLTTANNLLKW